MQRIYLPDMKLADVLEISEKNLYHQLTRVLRARVGQELIFFDGKTLEDHLYSMIHIDKKSVSFKRVKIVEKNSDLGFGMNLYQACPNKLSKFETIVQKCCEVGYRKIVFFESERSQKFVLSDNKKQRLHKIAIEAVEQCYGNIIPEIEYLSGNTSPLNLLSLGGEEGRSLLCHTENIDSKKISDIDIKAGEDINIFVGPEGGFTLGELENIPAQKVHFGNRILRCETVGEVVGFYISQKKES